MFVRSLALVMLLLIGWVVFARPSNGSAPPTVYMVRPHDTLWLIAERRYGGDPRDGIWKIEQRNHLHGAVIRPGQRLVIP